MKRLTTMLAVVAGLFLLCISGCTSDPVKNDIASYSKTAMPLMNKFDDEIIKKLDEVNRESDKTAFLNKIRNEIVPLLKDIKAQIIAVKPKTTELQDVNQMGIAMLDTMEVGMGSLADSIEKNNQEMYKDSIDKINSCQQMENKFKEAFKALAKKHNVDLD